MRNPVVRDEARNAKTAPTTTAMNVATHATITTGIPK